MTDHRYVTASDDGMVIACPECDRGGCVYERIGDNTYAGDPDDDYACNKCGATFNEYVERTSRQGGFRNAKYSHLSLEDVGLEPGAGP